MSVARNLNIFRRLFSNFHLQLEFPEDQALVVLYYRRERLGSISVLTVLRIVFPEPRRPVTGNEEASHDDNLPGEFILVSVSLFFRPVTFPRCGINKVLSYRRGGTMMDSDEGWRCSRTEDGGGRTRRA